MLSVPKTEGVTYYRRDDGIDYYHLTKPTPDQLEGMAKIMKENDLASVAKGEHVYAIFDLRDIWVTPNVMRRAIQAASITPPELHESIAIIGGNEITMNIMRIFVNRIPQREKSAFHIFRTLEDAVNWLHERRAKASPLTRMDE